MEDKEVKYAELAMPLNGGTFAVYIPNYDTLSIDDIQEIEDLWKIFGKRLAKTKRYKMDKFNADLIAGHKAIWGEENV
jgi:hypothetical protein